MRIPNIYLLCLCDPKFGVSPTLILTKSILTLAKIKNEIENN